MKPPKIDERLRRASQSATPYQQEQFSKLGSKIGLEEGKYGQPSGLSGDTSALAGWAARAAEFSYFSQQGDAGKGRAKVQESERNAGRGPRK